MPTKKATQNSLLIVLFSQTASILRTLLTGGVPPLDLSILLGMMVLAVVASEVGRRINRRIDNRQATLFLEGAMVLIMGINVYNIFKFLL
jgi:uncharacterized membrane protein YfcA